MMRIRAVDVRPVKKSDPLAALALPADAVGVRDKLIPEIDFSHFLTRNPAAELILSVPQKMEVKVIGVGKVGNCSYIKSTSRRYSSMPIPKSAATKSATSSLTRS